VFSAQSISLALSTASRHPRGRRASSMTGSRNGRHVTVFLSSFTILYSGSLQILDGLFHWKLSVNSCKSPRYEGICYKVSPHRHLDACTTAIPQANISPKLDIIILTKISPIEKSAPLLSMLLFRPRGHCSWRQIRVRVQQAFLVTRRRRLLRYLGMHLYRVIHHYRHLNRLRCFLSLERGDVR